MDAFLLSAVRTPIGKFLGGLTDIPAPKLGAQAIHIALGRTGLGVDSVDEVVMGNVVQAGVGQNPARQAALLAGFPDTIAAYTVNKVCGSGLKAVMLAAQSIRAGDANLVVAGGMESMSNAPYLLTGARKGFKYGDQTTQDSLIRDGLWCALENCSMGDSAEHIARKCEVSRAAQDEFSVESHRRAAAAWNRGDFATEVCPITIGNAVRSTTITRDEGIRSDTTPAMLCKLKPAFQKDGTVTAGNASQLSDGAAAVVVASDATVEKRGIRPLARIVSYATSGVAPKELFIAPVTAIRMACEKAKLTIGQIDLIELNEAFAAQMLACCWELKLDLQKVNVNGGGIALGHPIGASGARVLTTLAHALNTRNLRYGVASLCLGGGNAVAMVIERTA